MGWCRMLKMLSSRKGHPAPAQEQEASQLCVLNWTFRKLAGSAATGY